MRVVIYNNCDTRYLHTMQFNERKKNKQDNIFHVGSIIKAITVKRIKTDITLNSSIQNDSQFFMQKVSKAKDQALKKKQKSSNCQQLNCKHFFEYKNKIKNGLKQQQSQRQQSTKKLLQLSKLPKNSTIQKKHKSLTMNKRHKFLTKQNLKDKILSQAVIANHGLQIKFLHKLKQLQNQRYKHRDPSKFKIYNFGGRENNKQISTEINDMSKDLQIKRNGLKIRLKKLENCVKIDNTQEIQKQYRKDIQSERMHECENRLINENRKLSHRERKQKVGKNTFILEGWKQDSNQDFSNLF